MQDLEEREIDAVAGAELGGDGRYSEDTDGGCIPPLFPDVRK